MSQAPQADAPNTVWVKRMDVAGAQFVLPGVPEFAVQQGIMHA
jgi:hypothetical protein